jgi:hypothetical protein
MNNEIRKGGQPEAMKVFFFSARLGRHLAAALLAAERTGVHGPGPVHREPRGRSADRDADCPDDTTGSGRGAAAASAGASPQLPGLLDQGVCSGRWIVYRDERGERVQQVLRARPQVSVAEFRMRNAERMQNADLM